MPEPRSAALAQLIVWLVVLMATLQGSAVNVALPTLAGPLGFDATPQAVGWVALAYSLVLSAAVLPAGRLGDLVGMRRVFGWGTALFTLASLLCAAAPSLELMVGARVVQGAGACLLSANGVGLLSAASRPEERGRQLARLSAVVAVGLIAGPSLGGFLVEVAGWRSIFLLPLPFGALCFALAMRVLPKAPRSGEPFDRAGALWSVAAVVLVAFAVRRLPVEGRGPLPAALLLAAALGAGVVFVRGQRRTTAPLLDPSLFTPRLTRAVVAKLMSFVVLGLLPFVLPFFLEHHLGLRPAEVGLVMLVTPTVTIVVAPLAGHLADRANPHAPAAVGLALFAGGAWSLADLSASWTVPDVLWRLALAGAGSALFQSPNNVTVMSSAPRERYGIASATLALVRSVGFLLALALATALFGRSHLVPVDNLGLAFRLGAIGVTFGLGLEVWSLARERRGRAQSTEH